jgi:hypothetical protein
MAVYTLYENVTSNKKYLKILEITAHGCQQRMSANY